MNGDHARLSPYAGTAFMTQGSSRQIKTFRISSTRYPSAKALHIFQVLAECSMSLFIYTAIPIVLTTLWLYTVHMTRSAFPQLRNKRICLLIAHPDDEAMFFAPTLLALTDQEAGNHVKILCLSNGVSQRFPDPFTTRPQKSSRSPLGLNWQN